MQSTDSEITRATRIIYSSQNLRYPPRGGPELRVVNSILALATISKLTVVIRRWQEPRVSSETLTWLREMSIEIVEESAGLKEPWFSRHGVLRNIANWISLIREPGIAKSARFIVAVAKRKNIQLVWVGYAGISSHLVTSVKRRYPGLKVVADTDSVYSEFLRRTAQHQKGLRYVLALTLSCIRHFQETTMLKIADAVTTVSERDRLTYESLGCQPEKLFAFVNAVNSNDSVYHSIEFETNSETDAEILIIGSFGNHSSPMNRGTMWFIMEVLPLLLKSGVSPRVNVVGKGSLALSEYFSDKNVRIWGQVESVVPFFRHSQLMVVPLLYEGGTRLKIIEAGVFKCPIVSTTLGIEGLDLSPGVHCLCADTPDQMAAAIASLLVDRAKAQKLASALHDHVNSRFTLSSLVEQASDIVSKLQQ